MELELAKIAEIQKAVWIRKERKKRHRMLLTQLLFEYSQNSTLHGVRYTTERTLSTFEKLFWVVMVAASGVFCAYFIVNVFDKWTTSPIIVSVGERMVPADSIPFPAITICPQIKSKATVYDYNNQVKNIDNLTETELEEFYVIDGLCNYELIYEKLKKMQKKVTKDISKILEVIKKVSPSVNETVGPRSRSMFTNSYTWEGLCFTYNNVAAKELFREGVQPSAESERPSQFWSLEAGYEPEDAIQEYPERSRLKLTEPHRYIHLHSRRAYADPLCNAVFSGYTIYLSHPADVPQTPIYYYAALHGQMTSLAINAQIYKSSKSLKKYPVDKRQCYFPEDVQLKYFKLYTYNNCRLECLTNYTRSFCGCVAYYMPRMVNDSVPVCLDVRQSCMGRAERYMARVEGKAEWAVCRCLPMCDYIKYDAEVLKTEFKLDEYLRASNQTDVNMTGMDAEFSAISVFFKQTHFVAMHRSELFGFTDLIANIGGLLGVFLGFSFLSLIEIFYFLFVRIGFTLNRDVEEEKKMQT